MESKNTGIQNSAISDVSYSWDKIEDGAKRMTIIPFFMHFIISFVHGYRAIVLSHRRCTLFSFMSRKYHQSRPKFVQRLNVDNNEASTVVMNLCKKFPMESMDAPFTSFEEKNFQIMNREQLRPVISPLQPSPVEILSIRGRDVYIKRDDLLRLENSNVSGNKARKMLALNQLPAKDFPTYLISYGGSQSNAMLALAAIVQSKNRELNNKRHPETPTGYERELGCKEELSTQHVTSHPVSPKRFIYYSKKLPRFLKKNPSGNFFRAKTLGMEMIELSNDKFRDLFGGAWGGKHDVPIELLPPGSGDSIWIPQGGACDYARLGCRLLAYEIFHFWSLEGNGRPLSVFVPGGTCTTALWVHQELQALQAASCLSALMDIQVIVIPCVGDDGYAERQMMALNMATGGKGNVDEIPKVLKPAPESSFYLEKSNHQSYFRFGDPNSEILETFRELERSGLNVDLLYGAPSWNILLRHWPLEDEENVCNSKFMDGREVMYVHSGGLEGVNSQLMRYRHAGLIEGEEVQHPERQRWSSKIFLEKNIG